MSTSETNRGRREAEYTAGAAYIPVHTDDLAPEEMAPRRTGQSGRRMRKRKHADWLQDLFDGLQLLVLVLVVVVGLFTFVVGLVGVNGNSMYPTLHNGDMMLVQRIGYTVSSGDVVVLRKDGTFDDQALVKRVIATGGQTVYIDYDNNTITVDGVVLEEPYLNYETDIHYGDDYMAQRYDLDEDYVNQEFTVPEGYVFVCGDNRNHSSDSRVAELGMVDERYIIGRVLLVIYPFSDFGWVN